MRRVHKPDSQRGVALLMVMIALTILAAMTADFIENNQTYVRTAGNHRDAVQAEYLAKSAVNMSRLLLSMQSLPMLKDQLNFPFWEYADMMLEPFATPVGEEGMLGAAMGFTLEEAQGVGLPEGQEFSVEIVDEESKLNVNLGSNPRNPRKAQVAMILAEMMQAEMYDDIFNGSDYRDEVEREEVLAELYDFVDGDQDNQAGSGGEEDYYSDATPEYERKNAPYDSLQELHLVNGIGDDFWTAFVEPNPEEPASRVLTVWGTGKVNVNTANTMVLYSSVCMLVATPGNFPCLDMLYSANLSQILQLHESLKALMPVKNVKEFVARLKLQDPMMQTMLLLGGTGSNPLRPVEVPLSKAKDVFVTKSKVFSIYAEGTVRNVTKRIHVVIDGKPKLPDVIDPSQSLNSAGGRVLYWRQE